METNPLSKLIELDKRLTLLEERGKAIREPFNAMMKRQQEHYSFLLNVQCDPDFESESGKERIKNMKEFIEMLSMSFYTWNYSMDGKKELYQKWMLSEIVVIKNNPKAVFYLNHSKEMKALAITLEGILNIQTNIIFRLEASVEAAKEARVYTDSMLMDLN